MRRTALERLLPLACLAGAALLVASQFMTIFELNSAGSTAEALVDSTDQHWYAMAILGGFAALATVGAVATGSKPLAVSVAIAGGAALLLVLVIDLPDAGKTGNVSDPVRSFVTVEADPQGGFWIELIGALVLAVCGGALSTLTPDQLLSLRPRARRLRRADRERPAAPPSSAGTDRLNPQDQPAANPDGSTNERAAKTESVAPRPRKASRSGEAG